MINVSIKDNHCVCNIEGDPRILAVELVQIEQTVMEQVAKRGITEVVLFNIIYHAIEKSIADAANDRANLKCACDKEQDKND